MKYITLTAFINFCIYAVSSLVMLVTFTRVYLWLTPYDEFEQIKAGSTAPAIALSGALMGFVVPILSVSYHGITIIDFLIWSTVAGVMQIIVFKFLYWAIPLKIERDNSAIAILYASLAVCVGLINAFSLIPQ